MTTIAYRNGELAGDGRVTSDDTIVSDRDRKVFKFSDGRLFTYSGDVDAGEKLKLAVQRHRDLPDLGDKVSAILVMPDGKVFSYESSLWVRDRSPFVSIGSGMQYAYGAMEAGATAEAAVRIACKRHTHTGGLVRVVRLSK